MSNGINISTTVDSPIRFGRQGEVLRINTGGNVGIGTTSPSEKLEVNGNAKATAFCNRLMNVPKKILRHSRLLLKVFVRFVCFVHVERNQTKKSIGFIAQELEKSSRVDRYRSCDGNEIDSI